MMGKEEREIGQKIPEYESKKEQNILASGVQSTPHISCTVLAFSVRIMSFFSRCQFGGSNPAQNGCRPPPRRDREELSYMSIKESYSHGEQVLYNCQPGYIKHGRFRMKCNNGRWETVLPFTACKRKPCGHPGDIQFGSFDLVEGDEFSFGARVVFKCDEGYNMRSQTNYRECRADGWNNDIPRCEKTTGKCDRAPSIENGDIIEIPQTEYNSSDIVHYKCQAYHRLEGNPEVRCLSGHWTETPRCIVPCTASEEDMQRNNIRLRWIRFEKLYVMSGDVAEFTCREGYRPAPSSPPFRVRCIDGTFEYPQCI